MAKYVVEYKLDRDPVTLQRRTPAFISDGGYYPGVSGTFIGVTCDTDDCYVPQRDSETPVGFLVELTESELSTRLQGLINSKTLITYTEAEADTDAAAFFAKL